MHCHACGKEIEKESLFCRHCGARQHVEPAAATVEPPQTAETAETAEAPQPQPRTSATPIWIAGGVIVLLLLFVALGSQRERSSAPASVISTNALSDEALMGNDVTTVDAGAPPSEGNLTGPSSSPADPWSYRSSEDKVRGGQSYYASTTSTNSVNLDFPYQGGSTLTMTVRKSPAYGADVLLVLSPGQLLCHAYDGCYATVRFDDGPAERVALSESADNSSDTAFVTNAEPFISKLKKAKKAIVELEIYEAGRPQFEFDVRGLKWDH